MFFDTGENSHIPTIVCVRMGNYSGRPMKASGIQTAGYLWRLVVDAVAE